MRWLLCGAFVLIGFWTVGRMLELMVLLDLHKIAKSEKAEAVKVARRG